MIEQFRIKRFTPKVKKILADIDSVVTSYMAQGIRLTLRQLYYQLVAKALIPNSIQSYQKLSRILTDARYCGLVDWEAIEDRVRVPTIHPEWDSIPDLVDSAIDSYRNDRWEGQKHYVELFTEKDALSSILHPITNDYHIMFCVNRGYSSATAMYQASKRFIDAEEDGKLIHLLYLGDHDPSGLDMVRDIDERLTEFGAIGIDVQHIALTQAQIKTHNPPPNPAKITDPRAKAYISKFGKVSWEVDALPPQDLQKVVRKSIAKFVDKKKMDAVIKREDNDKKKLIKLSKNIK